MSSQNASLAPHSRSPHPGDSGNICRDCAARLLSICDGQPEAQLDRLAAITTTLSLSPHATFLNEGDPAAHMFNVTSGTVKTYKLMPDGRRQIVGFLMAGDFLGLALNGAYAYSAETVTPVSLCRFPRKQLELLFDEFPTLERKLRERASNELAAAQDLMLLLGRKTARERLATFLLLLSRRLARIGLPANPITLPMSRAEIADYLGLTTETVSRALTQLKQDGIVSLHGNTAVQIEHPDQLLHLAEGD